MLGKGEASTPDESIKVDSGARQAQHMGGMAASCQTDRQTDAVVLGSKLPDTTICVRISWGRVLDLRRKECW